MLYTKTWYQCWVTLGRRGGGHSFLSKIEIISLHNDIWNLFRNILFFTFLLQSSRLLTLRINRYFFKKFEKLLYIREKPMASKTWIAIYTLNLYLKQSDKFKLFCYFHLLYSNPFLFLSIFLFSFLIFPTAFTLFPFTLSLNCQVASQLL